LTTLIDDFTNRLETDNKTILELAKDKDRYEKTQNNLQEEQQIFIG